MGAAVEGSGGIRATMLRRIPSLFLNDAGIYSEDAVLWQWRGRYVMLRSTLLLLLSMQHKLFCIALCGLAVLWLKVSSCINVNSCRIKPKIR